MGNARRASALILSAVMALSFTSCAGKAEDKPKASSSAESSAVQQSMMGNLVSYGPALLSDVEKDQALVHLVVVDLVSALQLLDCVDIFIPAGFCDFD